MGKGISLTMELDAATKHERELREQYQDAHMAVHRAEAHALRTAREGDEKALEIASKEIDRRLEGMNQIREQMNSERGMYITREQYDVNRIARDTQLSIIRDAAQTQLNTIRDTMDNRLKILETSKSNMEGRIWMMGAAVTTFVLLLQTFLYYFVPRR